LKICSVKATTTPGSVMNETHDSRQQSSSCTQPSFQHCSPSEDITDRTSALITDRTSALTAVLVSHDDIGIL